MNVKYDHIAVGEIFCSTDYASFKKLLGNRAVSVSRKALIRESIRQRGWIRNPIIVNERMEIIDGQGRFEALVELGLPVEYVVAPGATIVDCVALNMKQANWKNRDYVECYAALGFDNYKLLLSLYGKYDYLPETCINILVGASNSDGGGCSREVRDGGLKIIEKTSLLDRLAFADECMRIIGDCNGRTRLWCGALKFVYLCKKIDTDLFLKKIRKRRSLIVPCANIKQVLECLEQIYNYGSRTDKVYFVPEWDYYLKTQARYGFTPNNGRHVYD